MCTNTCMKCECDKPLLRRYSIHSPSCILRNVLTHPHSHTHTHTCRHPGYAHIMLRNPFFIIHVIFCYDLICYINTGSNKRPHHCSIPIHCIRMEQSGSTHASTQFQCSGRSVCTLLLKIDQRRQEEREKKRAGRSWEVEKKRKQGHQHWMTTSACPIQLRSLRAKIPFQEAGKEGERQRMKEGDTECQADDRPLPLYLFLPFLPIIITTGNRPLWCLFTYGVSCLGLLLLFMQRYFLKESQNMQHI